MKIQFDIIGYIQNLPIELVSIENPKPDKNTKNILVTAGVHGNERPGPPASEMLVDFFRNTIDTSYFNVNIYIIPCVNPTGWTLNQRRNFQDIDINRDMDQFKAKESNIIRKIMKLRKYDLHLDCHSFGGISNFLVISANYKSDEFGKGVMSIFGYSYPIKKKDFKKKKKYKRMSEGVFRTTNNGTLKGFTSKLGVPYCFRIEAPRKLSLLDQIQETFELLLLFIQNL